MLQDLDKARRQLEQAHQEWMAALDVMEDPIFLHDKDFHILRCNRAYQRCAGIPFKQLIGRLYYEVYPKTHAPLRHCLQAMEGAAAAEEEVAVGDRIFRSRSSSVADGEGNYLYSIHTLEDITAAHQARVALKESEAQYRRLFEASKEGILLLDAETGMIKDANPFILDLLSYDLGECVGKMLWEIGLFADIEASKLAFKKLQTDGYIQYEDLPLQTKGGQQKDVEFVSSLYDVGGRKAIQCNIRDITERKRSERALQDEKEFSDMLIESLPDIFYLIGQQGTLLRWSRKGAELFGLSEEEMLRTNVLTLGHEQDRTLIARMIQEAFATGSASTEARLVLRNGVRNYAMTTTRVEARHEVNVIGFGIDITQLKQSEAALLGANRELKTLSAANLALVRAASEDELVREVASIIVEKGGYQMAWVGYAEHDAARTVRPVAQSGIEAGYLENEHFTWADTDPGPTATAIRTGVTVVNSDYLSYPDVAPWRENAIKRGYQSSIAIPLVQAKQVLGALTIHTNKVFAFGKEEVALLEELASDLSYGIITLRTRAEHEQHATVLRQSLEQSVQTIAATVEARDPYTAGHQRRVGDLATAIAQAMGLPEEQIHGIHLAAIIHDLGKIHIPAEILSKPGRLNELEYLMIKTHPQEGYDILKDVKFPWPIADMVLQHHERLDGSGYPQGLKGDQIILGARILGVSDLVEAMSSHRPYRPGLGIEAALGEIIRGRGTLFDPQVADACVALFREHNYVLPN